MKTVSADPCQRAGQGVAQIVCHDLDIERGAYERLPDKGDHPRIHVDDGEARDRVCPAELLRHELDGDGGDVVVAEQQDSLTDERAGFVQGEDAAELGVDRAVRLVDLEARRWARVSDHCELAGDALQ